MPTRDHFHPPPFHENRPGLVGPVRTDPFGINGPTEGQARGPSWRRTSRGLYVPADVEQSVEQRIVEAAAVLPGDSGVTGWAALRWWGGTWFDGIDRGRPLPVDLAIGHDIRAQVGYVVHKEKMDPRQRVVCDGLSVTTAVRSLCFMMRYARDVREAVVLADLAALSDLVSTSELEAYCLEHPAWTGIPQARDALPFVEENIWSRWEGWLNLVWRLDAGLPPPLCNRPIFDRSGHHVATPDLLDVESGTYGEYDGSGHLLGRQRARDVARENDLRNLGLEGFTVLAADISHPEQAVRKMTDARRRARWEPESTRRWTVEPPWWWAPTHTVDLRRQRANGRPG